MCSRVIFLYISLLYTEINTDFSRHRLYLCSTQVILTIIFFWAVALCRPVGGAATRKTTISVVTEVRTSSHNSSDASRRYIISEFYDTAFDGTRVDGKMLKGRPRLIKSTPAARNSCLVL